MTLFKLLTALAPVLFGLPAALVAATALIQPSRGVSSRANHREGFNSR